MFQKDFENLSLLQAENAQLRLENDRLRAEVTEYKKRCDEYMAAYEQLKHQVHELLRHRFGKKSERFIEEDATEPDQKDTPNDEQDTCSEPQNRSNRKSRHSGSNKPLVTRTVIIPLDEADKRCTCGCERTIIRYEIKTFIDYQPAVFEIVEQRREVGACPNGCDGSMKTAPAPLQVLSKSGASDSFLSFLVVSKLEDRQPLYHLAKQLKERYGIDCSRQTMARWLIELIAPLTPLYNLLKDPVIEYDVSSCDATTLQVLNEPGRPAETKSYVYCMRGGPPGKEVVLYAYNDRLHKQFVASWYEGYKGFLHVDGDNFFDLIGSLEGVDRVNCNTHARRKFEPIAQSTKGSGLAKEVLRFYKALYKIERKAKELKLTPQARYELRQKESKPILNEFKQWLDRNITLVLPQSPLGKGIQYCLNRWDGLIRYCDDGRLEMDNNLTEQEIKPFVMARKNFLFAATVDGAHALCLHLSLIRTARLHGLDPYHYYAEVLARIPHCKSVEDYEQLLPWNLKKNFKKDH